MAGFMSGFGDAFAKGFLAKRERNAQEEQDIFKMKYTEMIKRRDKVDEWKREDAKKVKKAQGFVEQYQQPPEAVAKIYEWIDADFSDEAITKKLEEGQFLVEKVAEAQKADGIDVQMEESGLTGSTPSQSSEAATPLNPVYTKEQQMGGPVQQATDRVSAPPVPAGGHPMEPPAPVQQERRGISDFFVNPEERADKKLAGMGITDGGEYTPPSFDSQFKITYAPKDGAGFKKLSELPNSIEDARAYLTQAELSGDPTKIAEANLYLKAQKMALLDKAQTTAEGYIPSLAYIRDDNGKIVDVAQVGPDGNGGFINLQTNGPIDPERVIPMNKSQMEFYTNVIKEYGKPLDEHAGKIFRLKQGIRLNNEMRALVDPKMGGNTDVLNLSAQAASWVDEWVRNITGGLTLIEAVRKGENINITIAEKAEQAAEEALKKGGLDPIAQQATRRALLEAKAIRMAYIQAAAIGAGEGRSVSNQDFDRIYQSIMGNGNPTAFLLGNAEFLQGQRADLKMNAELMNGSNRYGVEFLFEDPDAVLSDEEKASLETAGTEFDPNPGSQAKSDETGLPEGWTATGEFTPEGDPLYRTPDGKLMRRKKNSGK